MVGQKNQPSTSLARAGDPGMSAWSPWNEMTDFRHRFDDLISRAFGYTPLSRLLPSDMAGAEPAVDIYGTDDKILLFVALPGFGPDTINVEATRDTVTIHGECKPLYENANAVVYRQGWVCGAERVSATYSLPDEIDPNHIKATFKNGILELEMMKSEQARKKGVHVSVHAAP